MEETVTVTHVGVIALLFGNLGDVQDASWSEQGVGAVRLLVLRPHPIAGPRGIVLAEG